MSEERIVDLSSVPGRGRGQAYYADLARRAKDLEPGKAIATDVPEHRQSNARQAMSKARERLGGFDYSLTKGVLYVWAVKSPTPTEEK